MNYDVFVQAIGLVASVFGILSFFQKSDKFFRVYLLVAASTFFIHFLLLGAFSGAAVAGINATRTVLSMKFHRSDKILIFALFLYVLAIIFTYEDPSDLLPIFSGAVATIGLFKFSGIKLRMAFLFTETAWITYALVVKSVGGIIASSFALSANLYTIYKLVRDNKNE